MYAFAASVDFATIKYSLSGDQVWVARYDGPGGGVDQPAPPAGWSLGGGTIGSYLQTNQGIIVTTEVLNPVPEVSYLAGRIPGLNVNRGLEISLTAKLSACLASLLADNAAARQDAHNMLVAFINQLESLVVEGLVSEDAASELIAAANQIIKGILGIETTVVYVAGQSTGVGTNVDFALVKYDAAAASPAKDTRPGFGPGPGFGPAPGGQGKGKGKGRPGGGSGGRGGFGMDYASPVLAQGNIYYMTRSGEALVYTAGPECKLISQNALTGGGDFSATPAISDGQLFIRSSKFLYCIAQPNK